MFKDLIVLNKFVFFFINPETQERGVVFSLRITCHFLQIAGKKNANI